MARVPAVKWCAWYVFRHIITSFFTEIILQLYGPRILLLAQKIIAYPIVHSP